MKITKIIIIAIFIFISLALKNSETQIDAEVKPISESWNSPLLSENPENELTEPQFVDHGILHIDENGRYFVFGDGTPYIPIGLNKFPLYMATDSAIDSLLHLWSEHGVNYLRIWVGIGADPEIEVGKFDEKRMRKLDHIVNTCEKYGLILG